MKLSVMRPSWRKVLADLWADKTRTFLVVTSIAVGVFAIGTIMTTYVMLSQDIRVSYASIQPANIEVFTSPFDDTVVDAIKNIPGVADAEGRQIVSLRASKDGIAWLPLDIFANRDFADSEINLLTVIEGTSRPDDRQLLVRKDLMNDTGFHVGDEVQVVLADGTIRSMPVVGVVGDQSAAGDFTAPPRGYVTQATAEWLGGQDAYNRLFVRAQNGDDEKVIEAVATKVEDKLERSSHTVYRTETNKTTEHPMASTVLAMLGVLAALGVLITVLSSSLIFNTLNALLSQHRRQIGVMKRFGAFVYREVAGNQGHSQGDHCLHDDDSRNHAEALQLNAHHVADEGRKPVARHHRHRHGASQRNQPIRDNERNVHHGNLTAAGSHQLHHPDLASMLAEQRVEGVENQRAAQDSDQNAQGRQHAQHCQHRGCHGVFGCLVGFGAIHRMA
jgi:hypothetical protein